jgi:hypothetical protein
VLCLHIHSLRAIAFTTIAFVIGILARLSRVGIETPDRASRLRLDTVNQLTVTFCLTKP